MVALDLYRALWRRRYLIAILTLATVASAWFVVSRQTKIYKSTTLVRVEQQVTDPTQVGNALGVAQHLAQTYAQIVSTDAMADRIFRALHGRVPRSHVQISATPVQDLELLYISAKGPNPREAAEVANAAPAALRAFIAQTQSEGAGKDLIVTVNPAAVSATPISPRVKLSLIIAFIAGLVFNGGLALLMEFLSDRLPPVDDFEAALGKPVLATVPMLTFRNPDIARLQERLGLGERAPGSSPRMPLGRSRRVRPGGGRLEHRGPRAP